MNLDQPLLDALTEFVGLGVGRAADVLNTMLKSHIALSVPAIRVVTAEELESALGLTSGSRLAAVEMGYSGGLKGSVELIFTATDASILVDFIAGSALYADEDFDAIRSGTLAEVGNIVINALLGTLANVLRLELTYTVPAFIEGPLEELLAEADVTKGCVILLARTRFEIEELRIEGDLAAFFSMGSFENLKKAIEEYLGE